MCVLNAYLLSTVGVSSTLLVVAISASVEPSANKGEKKNLWSSKTLEDYFQWLIVMYLIHKIAVGALKLISHSIVAFLVSQ